MTNDQSLILKKMLLFAVIVAVLDQGIGRGLKRCYFAQTSGYEYRTTYVVNKVKANVIIFGSSRAAHHYNSPLLQDSLHTSVYNAGRDGTFIFYYYAMLKAVLNRYPPKLVIVDITPEEFEHNDVAYERLNMLLPYYDAHPNIREVCNLRGPYEPYKMLSGIYPQNSNLLTAITTLLKTKRDKINEAQIKGYLPLEGEVHETKQNAVLQPLDTLKVAYFKKLIAECKAAKIKLAVVVSPEYKNYPKGCASIRMAEDICHQQGISFFNYYNAPAFNAAKLYADPSHLNNTGATLFTKAFMGTMKRLL
jgi:hypothetical protein